MQTWELGALIGKVGWKIIRLWAHKNPTRKKYYFDSFPFPTSFWYRTFLMYVRVKLNDPPILHSFRPWNSEKVYKTFDHFPMFLSFHFRSTLKMEEKGMIHQNLVHFGFRGGLLQNNKPSSDKPLRVPYNSDFQILKDLWNTWPFSSIFEVAELLSWNYKHMRTIPFTGFVLLGYPTCIERTIPLWVCRYRVVAGVYPEPGVQVRYLVDLPAQQILHLVLHPYIQPTGSYIHI